MKFKNDNHRKAVFANMFGSGIKRSKVSGLNVKNFEVSSKSMKIKTPKISYKGMIRGQNINLKDIKTKEERVSCKMCKKRDASLDEETQICKTCSKEEHVFRRKEEEIKSALIRKEREEKAKQIKERWIKYTNIYNIEKLKEHLERGEVEGFKLTDKEINLLKKLIKEREKPARVKWMKNQINIISETNNKIVVDEYKKKMNEGVINGIKLTKEESTILKEMTKEAERRVKKLPGRLILKTSKNIYGFSEGSKLTNWPKFTNGYEPHVGGSHYKLEMVTNNKGDAYEFAQTNNAANEGIAYEVVAVRKPLKDALGKKGKFAVYVALGGSSEESSAFLNED